jgi:hypothetical protein
LDVVRHRRRRFGHAEGTELLELTGLCGITSSNGQTRDQWGWYVGTGFDYMVHKGSLVDVLLGVEYQHYDVGNHNAFCGDLRCNVASAGPYDLGTTGDLVRARLTIKTQGYGFLWAGPR